MVTLADGRTFQLAGVDLAGLTAEQRASFDQTLDHEFKGGPLLMDDLGNGRARFIEMYATLPRRNFESFYPFVTLIPTPVDYYPGRLDVAVGLVNHGLAKADPRGVENARALPAPKVSGRAVIGPPEIDPGKSYADMLRQAEDQACVAHVGIFQGPAELLLAAVGQRDQVKVAQLIAGGADVNAVVDGRTALFVACQAGDGPMVAFLLAHDASPTVASVVGSPYDWGMADEDLMLLLLEKGVPLPAGEAATRVLINAARYNDLRTLELAIKEGAGPQPVDRNVYAVDVRRPGRQSGSGSAAAVTRRGPWPKE